MDFKNNLRNEIERELKELKNRDNLSKSIFQNVIKTIEWQNSNKIFLFISFKMEVNTSHLIEEAKRQNKKVYAPLIIGKKMSFHRIDNVPENELVKNKFGIYEPSNKIPEDFPDRSSLMIIPGVSFTKECFRLGRGGGFYDRYLEKQSDFLKAGITFNIQMRDELQLDPWDKKLDMVITETNIYKDGDYGTN